ncbi:MAG: hypothetical protein AB3N15_11560 [Paracoccaceae bacterium]
MSGYVYNGRPRPTGLHKPMFDEFRKRRGLNEDGKPIRPEPERYETDEGEAR